MLDDEVDYGMLVAAEEHKYVQNEIFNGSPETRAKWDLDDWVYGLKWHPGLIDAADCPINEFTAEHWKMIVADGCGIEVQFCNCREELLEILTEDDFCCMGSLTMCTTIALDGDFLAHLMPLEEIEQEDFDSVFICDLDDFPTEESVLNSVGRLFPHGKIPDHLTWPHKGESLSK